MAELADDHASPGFGHPVQLPQGQIHVHDVAQTEGDGDRLEGAVGKGKPQSITGNEGHPALGGTTPALDPGTQHAEGEVTGDHPRPLAHEGFRGGSRTRRQVQDQLTAVGIDRVDHRFAPQAVLAE